MIFLALNERCKGLDQAIVLHLAFAFIPSGIDITSTGALTISLIMRPGVIRHSKGPPRGCHLNSSTLSRLETVWSETFSVAPCVPDSTVVHQQNWRHTQLIWHQLRHNLLRCSRARILRDPGVAEAFPRSQSSIRIERYHPPQQVPQIAAPSRPWHELLPIPRAAGVEPHLVEIREAPGLRPSIRRPRRPERREDDAHLIDRVPPREQSADVEELREDEAGAPHVDGGR